MVVTIARQHSELSELKGGLQEILQALPHSIAATGSPPTATLTALPSPAFRLGLHFSLSEVYIFPSRYPFCLYILLLSRLGGKALQWAAAVWERQGEERERASTTRFGASFMGGRKIMQSASLNSARETDPLPSMRMSSSSTQQVATGHRSPSASPFVVA